jgi:hypothetical protein
MGTISLTFLIFSVHVAGTVVAPLEVFLQESRNVLIAEEP